MRALLFLLVLEKLSDLVGHIEEFFTSYFTSCMSLTSLENRRNGGRNSVFKAMLFFHGIFFFVCH